MQEQREAREARVFNENNDWVTETKIRRPRPQGSVLGTFPATNNHSFSQCDLLYRGGVSPTACHSILDVSDGKLTQATQMCRGTCLESRPHFGFSLCDPV